jgi:hypothetical protein
MIRLVDVSLANFDAEGSIRLNDFQLDFIRGEHSEQPMLKLEHAGLLHNLQVVRTHPEQFAAQLTGRLLTYQMEPEVTRLLNELDANAPRPRLRQLWPALEQAGSWV